MRTGFLVKKVAMSQMFSETGKRIPLTVLAAQDCYVLGNKVQKSYQALVVGGFPCRQQKVTKSRRTICSKVNAPPVRVVKEFRVSDDALLKQGTKLQIDRFSIGQKVDISGITHGKGFAGGIKRHHFKGLEATHGVSGAHRSIGSTGQCQDPGRVFKGKKMPGHMGAKRVTIHNLEVLRADTTNKVLLIKGSVPGPKGGYLVVRDAIKGPEKKENHEKEQSPIESQVQKVEAPQKTPLPPEKNINKKETQGKFETVPDKESS